jgi:putative phosphoribosyl transferase
LARPNVCRGHDQVHANHIGVCRQASRAAVGQHVDQGRTPAQDADHSHQPTPRQTMSVLFEEIEQIPINGLTLEGVLAIPPGAKGVVLFAHGSGSSRHSPRNNFVARVLCDHGVGTLLMDLLSPEEDQEPTTRFDIALLTARLVAATHWLHHQRLTRHLPVGYFGASTGAAAALRAAARLGPLVQAVVSRGGRPDLAGQDALAAVACPTLLLVGGLDHDVLALNRQAAREMQNHLQAGVHLVVVPGATHLFEEPGTLEAVARHAAQWFEQHLRLRI